MSEAFPDTHHDSYSKTTFGFWLYLLTDFMLFATVFAAYAVLHKSTFGGPSGRELFNLPYTLTQTLILLVSAFTIGLAGACAHRKNKGWTIILFLLSFFFGLAFIWMMVGELSHLISLGQTWKTNAFLSSFYTLIGMFGLHMIFALLWVLVLLVPVFRFGLSDESVKRLTCLRMFWQFLNVIWIFIFNIVYLMGVI